MPKNTNKQGSGLRCFQSGNLFPSSSKWCLLKTTVCLMLCQYGACAGQTVFVPHSRHQEVTWPGQGAFHSHVGTGLSSGMWNSFHWHMGWLLLTEMGTCGELKKAHVIKYPNIEKLHWPCISEITVLIISQYMNVLVLFLSFKSVLYTYNVYIQYIYTYIHYIHYHYYYFHYHYYYIRLPDSEQFRT